MVFKSAERAVLRPPEFYEADYFHGRASARDRRFEHRVQKATHQIQAAMEFTAARRLLDIGCSLGYALEAGNRLGLDSAGTDISEHAVAVCRDRGYRAEVASLERLPFADGAFDVVLMKHVLEHTPSPKTALREVWRVLADGGVVFIAVPNLNYWKGRLMRRTYRYFRPNDLGQQHYVYHTVDTLRRLVEACGFETVATSKAVYRRTIAARGLAARLRETTRFLALSVWQLFASFFFLKREVVVVARKDKSDHAGDRHPDE